MALGLNNLKRVDMPLNKETKSNQTCQKRWMIGRSGERGSGISVLAARHDDDDDDDDDEISNVKFVTRTAAEK